MLEHIIAHYNEEMIRIARIARSGFVIALSYEMGGPELIVNHMPLEWQAHYSRHSLMAVDPIVRWVLVTREGMARWSEINKNETNPECLAMLKTAKKFGLHYGFAGVVVSAKSGKRSFTSCARADREFTEGEMNDLYATFRSWANQYANTRPNLTDEHLAVLKLIAAGDENDAIAQKLGISKSAVNQRVSRLMSRMNVTNRAAAVAVATSRKLI